MSTALKLTAQQTMLLEKLKAGFRVYTTGCGKVAIHGSNESVKYLGKAAVKNLWAIERAGHLRSEYSVATGSRQYFLKSE